jgi:pimeloyl-ACP methyl ester carboxylesterase
MFKVFDGTRPPRIQLLRGNVPIPNGVPVPMANFGISRNLKLVVVFVFWACSVESVLPDGSVVSAVTQDGVTIHGEFSAGGNSRTAPLVLLFHQGGADGRGEYADLVPWLNGEGYRTIAWDQRAGGDIFGTENRTVVGLAPEIPTGFCDAYADLDAALDFVVAEGLAEQVVAWGSSYSAALVFRLAAENRGRVSGIVAFSPASGGPLTECRARMWATQVAAPFHVFRPEIEMSRESSIEQRDLLVAAGAEFSVVGNGVHGSSMLVDARTGHDMSEERAIVIRWLDEISGKMP